jgi:hypothetical protein
VRVIPEVRFATQRAPRVRDQLAITSNHCALWDQALLAEPDAEYIAPCNDYYLRSDGLLIQFLRSRRHEQSLAEGRIAWGTGRAGMPCNSENQLSVRAWHNQLVRWIKRNFSNRCVYQANHDATLVSSHRTTWVGPDAAAQAAQGVRLVLHSRNYSVVPVSQEQECALLAKAREPKRLLVQGKVASVGPVVGYKQHFEVALATPAPPELRLPTPLLAGLFSTTRPTPKTGDRVVCVLLENNTSPQDGPWQLREIRVITASNQVRVLGLLKKSWRIA